MIKKHKIKYYIFFVITAAMIFSLITMDMNLSNNPSFGIVTIDSLTYGSYTLYIYDSLPNNLNGAYFCPQELNFSITQPQSALTSTNNLLTHVSCWGDSTGKARVIPSGGNSMHPYTYLWDNGETTAIADSLWADVNLKKSLGTININSPLSFSRLKHFLIKSIYKLPLDVFTYGGLPIIVSK